MDKNLICKGEEIDFEIFDTVDVGSFTLAFGDGFVEKDELIVSHAYNFHPPSGFTYARLILKGKDGICPTESEKPVFIHQVIADFNRLNGTDSVECINDAPYSFTNISQSASTYFWTFDDEFSNDKQQYMRRSKIAYLPIFELSMIQSTRTTKINKK